MSVATPIPPSAAAPAAHRDGAPRLARLDLLLVVLLALLAAVPRTVNLLGLDPFIDESSWVDWALRELQPRVPRTWFAPLLQDGRPPLHFWLMLPLTAVVDNGFLAGRLASALAGVLSTLALYGLGRELASRTTGAAAALLWALSPFSVFFARVSSDDALLALTAILATWASVRLARRPTLAAGALCGLCLGLGALAKTTGVLFAAAPPLAIVLLGQPRAWRRYLGPLAVAGLVGLVTIVPLLIWLDTVLAQLSLHTGNAGNNGGGGGLLARNVEISAGWLRTYLGDGFGLLVGAGLVLAVARRRRGLLLVTALGLLWLALLLDRSWSLFARYLLFPLFPAYLLAGFAVDRAATLAGRLAPAAAPVVKPVVIVLVPLLVLAPRAGLTAAIVLDPVHAAIPDSEHFRYVEQWYAVYGLGRVADELRERGREQTVTVLVPPASREDRVLVPYAALRHYLHRDPTVRFVEVPALWRAQDLREVRRLARGRLTYLLVNGSYTDAPGTPNAIPAYTRQLERRLAQDVPDAREVLRIPRPSAPNWLVLYRLDGGP